MKTIPPLILLLLINFLALGQTAKISKTKLEFDIPNDKWAFIEDKSNDLQTIQFFKRTPIVDEQQRHVIASIAIITEANVSYDVVTYSALKRSEMPIDIEEVFIPKDIKMKYKNGICYKGIYEDKSGLHRIYYIFLINNGTGVRVICDVTAELFEQVEPEFLLALKSIRVVK